LRWHDKQMPLKQEPNNFEKTPIISCVAHPFSLNRYRQITAVLSIAL
jgi:hypothetical protein